MSGRRLGKVLVTGASGLLGHAVCRSLTERKLCDEIVGVFRSGSVMEKVDVEFRLVLTTTGETLCAGL